MFVNLVFNSVPVPLSSFDFALIALFTSFSELFSRTSCRRRSTEPRGETSIVVNELINTYMNSNYPDKKRLTCSGKYFTERSK